MSSVSIIDMVDDGYIAYNFIAPILHGNVYDTYEEFLHAKNLGTIKVPFLPKLVEGTYILESGEIISTIYSFLYRKHLVRVVNHTVTEYWVHKYRGSGKIFKNTAYDINTLQPIERYEYISDEERKFDIKTGKLLQINYMASFNNLPEEIKNLLVDFPYRDKVFSWANKPYGTAIYFNF